MHAERVLIGLVVTGLALACSGRAEATASIGGTATTVAGGGACNNSKLVPGNTVQNSFYLSAATGCAGGTADAELRGDAATGSVGLRVSSLGNGLGSSEAAAQVVFADQWLIHVPVGTARGTITLPVSAHLDGKVSANAVFDSTFGRFLDYKLAIGPPFSFADLLAQGKITTTGSFSQTFSGVLTLDYTGQPLTAAVEMSLTVPALLEGKVDFYNTASISMLLPAGFSVTTSSGLPLVFVQSPVPEPHSTSLMMVGVMLLAGFKWRLARFKA